MSSEKQALLLFGGGGTEAAERGVVVANAAWDRSANIYNQLH